AEGGGVAALDEQALRVQAPEEVGVPEGGDQLGLVGVGEVQHRIGHAALGDDAVQAGAAFGAQYVAPGGVGGRAGGVVQEQVVVPVVHPQAAFGTGADLEGGRPGVGRGENVRALGAG